MTSTRRFEGDERIEMHDELHRYMDMGCVSQDKKDEADGMASDLARDDPSLLTDILGSKYGPRINVRNNTVAQAIACSTSGTWCMFAAERRYMRVLSVAHAAGIGMDDPMVFLNGGLLTSRSWILEPELVKFALTLGASPNENIQPGMFPRNRNMSAIEVLIEIIRCEPRHISVCQDSLRSLKIILGDGASVTIADYLLDIIEQKFGADERSLVLDAMMRGGISRTREEGSKESETPQDTAPKRARVRV